MNEIVYCGLKLVTECSYFKFTEGDHASIVTNPKEYAVEVTFPKGIMSKELGDLLNIKVTDDRLVTPTLGNGYHRINNVSVKLNGLEFIKLTSDPHVVRIALVDDYPSRVCQDYNSTTIVINDNDKSDPEFLGYVFSNLKYMKLRYPRKVDFSKYTVANFPKITIYDKSLDLTSKSTYIHKLRSNHNRYLIKAVDYEHQFFHDISQILEEFGVQLTRKNREEIGRAHV